MVATSLLSTRLRLPAPPVHQRRRVLAVAQQVAEAAEAAPAAAAPKPAAASSAQQVYLGKGRFIADDPKKYPGRDNDFTGGWAGGEVGLKAFVADAAPAPKKAGGKFSRDPEPIAQGRDTIYVGKGRFINDDAKKYPGRDNQLTGGFAGGEEGLKAFVATGDVPIDASGAGRRQQSPLVVAFVVALSATGGGLLLSSLEEVGEGALGLGGVAGSVASTASAAAALDDNTRLLLQAAVILIGVAGTLAGGRALVASITNRMKDTLNRLGVLAVFWIVLFVAAKLLLETP